MFYDDSFDPKRFRPSLDQYSQVFRIEYVTMSVYKLWMFWA